MKQIDLLYKLAARGVELSHALEGGHEEAREFYDRRNVSKNLKLLNDTRGPAAEELKEAVYWHRQIHWLQERFPDGRFRNVPGLCRVVGRADIEAADWSLTPGRYAGVSPAEVDEDFDFEQTIRDIHLELADLNKEACALAAKIQRNFEELGV